MMTDPSACSHAYKTAVLHLKRLKSARNQAEKLFAFVPLAILNARRGKDLGATPKYEELMHAEQFGVKILYDVIAEVDDPVIHYPRVTGEIAMRKTMIADLVKAGSPRQGQTEELIQTAAKIIRVACAYGPPDPKTSKNSNRDR
jgi:hypothetical protein